MLELISLAKDNAILVIGLLAVTFYLEGRIDSESNAIRTEVQGNRGEISDLRQDVSGLSQDVSDLRQEVSALRLDMHTFQLETTDRLARIETLQGEQAQAM